MALTGDSFPASSHRASSCVSPPRSARGAPAPGLAAFGFAGWIWFADRGPLAPPPVTITALKPVAGSADVSTALPIEVLYGIPTAETLHLWQPGR